MPGLNRKHSASQVLSAMLAQVQAPVLLTLEDAEDRQALLVLEHSTEPDLVVGVLDRDGDTAVVTLEREGVEKLRDAFTRWLEQLP